MVGSFSSCDHKDTTVNIPMDMRACASALPTHSCPSYNTLNSSRTFRLPVTYVFGKKTLDIDRDVEALASEFESNSQKDSTTAALLCHDVGYIYHAGTAG